MMCQDSWLKNKLALFKVEVGRELCNSFPLCYKVHQQRVKADLSQRKMIIYHIWHSQEHAKKIVRLKGPGEVHLPNLTPIWTLIIIAIMEPGRYTMIMLIITTIIIFKTFGMIITAIMIISEPLESVCEAKKWYADHDDHHCHHEHLGEPLEGVFEAR